MNNKEKFWKAIDKATIYLKNQPSDKMDFTVFYVFADYFEELGKVGQAEAYRLIARERFLPDYYEIENHPYSWWIRMWDTKYWQKGYLPPIIAHSLNPTEHDPNMSFYDYSTLRSAVEDFARVFAEKWEEGWRP